jgi:hypothetical protein
VAKVDNAGLLGWHNRQDDQWEPVVTLSSDNAVSRTSVFQGRLGGMAPWQNRRIRPVSIIIRLRLITVRRRIIITKLPFSMI